MLAHHLLGEALGLATGEVRVVLAVLTDVEEILQVFEQVVGLLTVPLHVLLGVLHGLVASHLAHVARHCRTIANVRMV